MIAEDKCGHQEGLSVVVCSYERHELLQQTLGCLLSQTLTNLLNYEIIVVDNSFDKAKAKKLAAQFADNSLIAYIVAERPRNVGIQAARFSILAYVDDDVIIPPQWAQAMYDAFVVSGPETALVGGKVSLAWPATRPLWMHDRILGYLGMNDHGPTMLTLTKGETVVGCNMAFDYKSLSEIGGFPENLGRKGGAENLLSNEELQVVKIFQKAGKKIIYAPAAELKHIVDNGRMEKDWFRNRIAWQAVSDMILGGKELRWRYLRAAARRIIWPALTVILKACGVSEALSFYLALEGLYDQKLIAIMKTKI
jgi:glucosyl-dolichyl phosphate glucuronosyltransferase